MVTHTNSKRQKRLNLKEDIKQLEQERSSALAGLNKLFNGSSSSRKEKAQLMKNINQRIDDKIKACKRLCKPNSKSYLSDIEEEEHLPRKRQPFRPQPDPAKGRLKRVSDESKSCSSDEDEDSDSDFIDDSASVTSTHNRNNGRYPKRRTAALQRVADSSDAGSEDDEDEPRNGSFRRAGSSKLQAIAIDCSDSESNKPDEEEFQESSSSSSDDDSDSDESSVDQMPTRKARTGSPKVGEPARNSDMVAEGGENGTEDNDEKEDDEAADDEEDDDDDDNDSESSMEKSTKPKASARKARTPTQSTQSYDSDTEEAIQKEKIRSSKLNMAIQGFRQTLDKSKQRADTTNESASAGTATTAPIFDPDSVEYNVRPGLTRTYHKAVCYRYKRKAKNSSEKDIDVVVGIKRFVSNKQAECVLIVPFAETILGMEEEGVDYKADYTPFSHCQVHGQVWVLPLKYFAGRPDDIDALPEWVYEPQTEGSWRRFGYYRDHQEQLQRKGRREEMRVLELFVGAGGMHLGFEKAGFTTVDAVDHDRVAFHTFRKNFKGVPVVCEDVNDYLESYRVPQIRQLLGKVDVIVVTAPCNGFSDANRNGGKYDKENNDLSLTLLEAVRQHKPAAAIFENVLGMWRRKHAHYLRNIVKGLMKLGYQCQVAELRACDYGSPQVRPRLILFATHKSVPPPKLPARTHGSVEDGLCPFVSVADALSGLDNGIDSDGNPLRNMGHSKTTLQPDSNDYVKLKKDGLAPAIRASSTRPIHYEHDRCISVRESATLQGFPTTFEFCGTRTEQYQQVGNAVPVELATQIAQAVRQVLEYKYEGEPL